MRKVIFVLTIAVLAANIFSGCSQGSEQAAEIVTPVIIVSPTAEPTPTDVPMPSIETSSVLLNDISTCYSLFPVAFADSNGDGYGDINGIIEKLPYLKYELGIDCIWLNPIHPSPSYHKYDVTDYYAIDFQFGTMEDYENLIAEMHKLDMYIIMDFVVNHTSSQHPWFIESKTHNEEYRDYYRWLTKEELKEHHMKGNWHIGGSTYYYAGFWSEMPELNLENEKVRQELFNIAEFWINKGVDGFRIDAARHLYDKGEYPEGFDTINANITFYADLTEHIKSINEDAFIISEVWTDFKTASKYYEGMEALFNFDIGEELIGAAYVGSKDIADTINYYNEQMAEYDNRIMGTFLSNHDQNRYIESLARSHTRAKIAVNLLFTLPGIPFVYYGEELGMIGKKPDENIREPFYWAEGSEYNTAWNLSTNNVNADTISLEEQMADENSLFNTYKDMIALRKQYPVFKSGGIMQIESGAKAIIAYTRFDENINLLVIHNTLANQITLDTVFSSDYSIVYQQDESSNILDSKLTLGGRSVIIIELPLNDYIELNNLEVIQ